MAGDGEADDERRRRDGRLRRSASLSPPQRYSRTSGRINSGNNEKDRHGISDSEDEGKRRIDRRRISYEKLPFEDIRDKESRDNRGRDRDRDRYDEGHGRKRKDDGSRISRDEESLVKKASSYRSRDHEERHYNRKREEDFDEERHYREKRETDFGDGRRYTRKREDDSGEERLCGMKREDDFGDDRFKHGMKSSGDTEKERFAHRYGDSSSNDQNLPDLYSIYRAKVQSIRPFGIFVRIEGFFKQGLVHVSHLSDHEVTDREDSDDVKVQAIGTIASEGDEVWVKVISLKDEGGNVKIGCSLKLVSQSTGKDLDPSNVKLDQQQKSKGSRSDPKRLVLDAIYNVVCSRCGGHGHLKTECFASGDKTYELIPEEEDELLEEPIEPSQGKVLSTKTSNMPGFGRGRSMVLPAWMTHGSGVNAKHLGDELNNNKKKKTSELPDNVTTVEEALALLAQVKRDKKDKKHRKKDGDKHTKEHRSKKDRKKRAK